MSDSTFSLYYYMPCEHFIENLENDEMKVSLPKTCNDPMEFRPNQNAADGRARGKDYSTDLGMICFSEDCTSPTMWAHYANKHRGVCLEFVFPLSHAECLMAEDKEQQWGKDDVCMLDLEHPTQYTELPCGTSDPQYAAILMKVKYSPRLAYPAISQVRSETISGELSDARYSRLYAAKGQEWSYEKEWRLFVTPSMCLSYHHDSYFVKGLFKHLKGVILGHECPLPEAMVTSRLREHGLSEAYCERVTFSEKKFALTAHGHTTDTRWQIPFRLTTEQLNAVTERIKDSECETPTFYIMNLIKADIPDLPEDNTFIQH